MNPDDAFDRCLASLHEAALDDTRWPAASALIDAACGVAGNALVVGEGSAAGHRIHFVRCFAGGESRQDLAREYFEVHYPHDVGMRRLMKLPEGRLVHLPDLWTEDERRTSPVYNEGWRSLDARNGLNAHFDDPDGLRLVWAVADPVGGDGWQSAQLELIASLLPHVRQFVRVRQALAAAGAPRRRAVRPAGQRPPRRGAAGPRRAGAGGQRAGARDPAPGRRAARPRRRPGCPAAGGPQPPAAAPGAGAAAVVGRAAEWRLHDGPSARRGDRGWGYTSCPWAITRPTSAGAGWRRWCSWSTPRGVRASILGGWR